MEKRFFIIEYDQPFHTTDRVVGTAVDDNSEDAKAFDVNDRRVKRVTVQDDSNVVEVERGTEQIEGALRFQREIRFESELYIYGYSDDLVEIEGDFSDELYYNRDMNLHVDDICLDVDYDGKWNFEVEGGSSRNVEQYPEDHRVSDVFCDYSELVIIRRDVQSEPSISWVKP